MKWSLSAGHAQRAGPLRRGLRGLCQVLGMAKAGGLVDFEVDLPVEFSPSLLQVDVRHRALVSWAPVPVDGVPQLGLCVVDVVGRL